jgi:hypothetical protein
MHCGALGVYWHRCHYSKAAEDVFFSEEKNQKTFSFAIADLAGGTHRQICGFLAFSEKAWVRSRVMQRRPQS